MGTRIDAVCGRRRRSDRAPDGWPDPGGRTVISALRRLGRAALLSAPDPLRRTVMAAIGRPLPPRAPRAARPPAVGPDAPFNASYVGSRPDLVEQLPETSRNILDLGCATGEVGVAIVKRIPEARVTGVELDPPMAAVAAGRIANVVSVDLEDLDAVRAALAGERFDAVIAGDILEHLVDPWRALRGLQPVLTNDALIIASLPNIGFWDTWWNVLVHRRWPYRPRGIHDSTHLRFFAGRHIPPLFEQAGFRVDAV